MGIVVPNLNTLVFTVYRPPSSDERSFRLVLDKIRETINLYPSLEIILLGDFNFPQISWENRLIQGGTRHSSTQANYFLDMMDECHLTQHIHDPTRIKNTLDLVLTKNPSLVHSYINQDTIMSDHKLIQINMYSARCAQHEIATQEQALQGLHQLNFHNTDIDWCKIKLTLGSTIDWEDEFREKEPEEMISPTHGKMLQHMQRMCPPKEK